MDESMIPEHIRLSAEAVPEVKRLQEWAEQDMMELQQAKEAATATQPQPPAVPCVPTVAAAAFMSPVPAAPCVHVPVEPVQKFDPSVLARVAVLKWSTCGSLA